MTNEIYLNENEMKKLTDFIKENNPTDIIISSKPTGIGIHTQVSMIVDGAEINTTNITDYTCW